MALKLVTPAATLPVSLARAKAFCRVEGTEEDTLIEDLIGAAVDHLEQITGRRFATETWDLVLDGFSDTIDLPLSPVQSVVSIKYLDANGNEQDAGQQYWTADLVSEPGWIVRRAEATWPTVMATPNAVTIRLQAGYDTLPRSLQQAVLLLVGHWYTNREAVVTGTIATEIPLGVGQLIHNYRVWLR